MDERSVILEIRAGTGGDEAALFAGVLFRMYERYAAKQGWKVEIVSESEGAVGGYKEIIADITGRGAYAKLKFESGVHRVQRVPDTEASGRIHTSAATVAVLPQAEDVDIIISDDDLKIDTMRAQGAGGQHVNKTEVGDPHHPSSERHRGVRAGGPLAAQEQGQGDGAASDQALRRRARRKLDTARAADRKVQVGSGDRSERIRTYNFPQGRVTDHRINLTLYKLPEIVEGEALGEIIDALVAENQAALLAAQNTTRHEACRQLADLSGAKDVAAARRILTAQFEQASLELSCARCAPADPACARAGACSSGLSPDRPRTDERTKAPSRNSRTRPRGEPVARILGARNSGACHCAL